MRSLKWSVNFIKVSTRTAPRNSPRSKGKHSRAAEGGEKAAGGGPKVALVNELPIYDVYSFACSRAGCTCWYPDLHSHLRLNLCLRRSIVWPSRADCLATGRSDLIFSKLPPHSGLHSRLRVARALRTNANLPAPSPLKKRISVVGAVYAAVRSVEPVASVISTVKTNKKSKISENNNDNNDNKNKE